MTAVSEGDTLFDVVIAGAGGAGTTAALRAADAGLSVLLLDSQPSFRRGCNTYMSTSMIPAAGTRWQEELGIADSPQAFYDDVMRKTNGTASRSLTRTLTDVGPELVDWLSDKVGLPLVLGTDFRYPGHSADRCHSVPERSGRALHRHMMSRVDAHPAITLASPLRLEQVELNPTGGVSAAVVMPPDGRNREIIATRAVVLATGGFGANHQLVKQHIPEIADAMYFGSEGCSGDGLRIGTDLHGDADFLDSYQGHGSVAVPEGILVTWTAVMHGGILVNVGGVRFGDETAGYSEFAKLTIAQPGATAWLVIDQRIDALCRSFQDYQDLIAAGAVRWCGSLEEAAHTISAPEAQLRHTLSAVQRFARVGGDPLGRDYWEAVLEAPFGLVKVTGALFHTQGGMIVDQHARVLRAGRPIRGLYAAGGAAAGISGHGAAGYLAGNGLLAAFGLGYVAGRHLASL